VVLPRRPECRLPTLLAPDTEDLGVTLPATPLHHLLLSGQSPLVMTRAALPGYPVAADLDELLSWFGTAVDAVLDHDQAIVRRCGDSVVGFAGSRPLLLRRSRGWVPQPLPLPSMAPAILACGADERNTFCLTRDAQAFLSQPTGDLNQPRAYEFFREAMRDLTRLLDVSPAAVACDLNAELLSSRYAAACGILPRVQVQHHHAHVAACLADHGLPGPALGVVMDNPGRGTNGMEWGGEFLLCTASTYRRLAHLRTLHLPGALLAAREPARMAYAWMNSVLGPDEARRLAARILPALPSATIALLEQTLAQPQPTMRTSAACRLLDAAAALLGDDMPVSYTGQTLARLKGLAMRSGDAAPFPFAFSPNEDPAILSFDPMLTPILDERLHGATREQLAARVQATFAAGITAVCRHLAQEHGVADVLLTGEVFEDSLILQRVAAMLEEARLRVLLPRRVGLNDGSIAFGQAVVAQAQLFA
jgi:hydrogenase maturation protein HypF